MRRIAFAAAAILIATLLAPLAAQAGIRQVSAVPSWAVPSSRLDRVAPDGIIEFELVLPWRHPAAVSRLVHQISDPSSSSYRRFLSSEEFRRRFAPAPAVVDATKGWLNAAGFEVGRMPLNRVIIPARGPARLVERVFATTLSRYRVGEFGLRAPDTAPMVPAALARLGIVVRGLDTGLTLLTPGEVLTPSMFVNPASVTADPPPAVPQTPANPADATPPTAIVYPKPCSAYDGATTEKNLPAVGGKKHPAVTCATTVTALRAAYGVDKLGKHVDGRGSTIAMVGSHALRNLPADLAEWSRRNKLPALREGQISQFSYPGAYETPADPSGSVLRPQVWMQQSAMLFESMRAIAPGANYLYVGSTSSLDLPNALLLAVDRHFADIVVNGWYSATESQVTPVDTLPIDRAAEQAAATGITVLVASGDLGDNANFNSTSTGRTETSPPLPTVVVPNIPIIPAHPSPSFPAHNPLVTSVGATSLLLGKNGSYLRELGWAKTTRTLVDGKWSNPDPVAFRGSGGGISQIYEQPSYQHPVVPDSLAFRPNDGLRGRAVPDISVNGDAETGMVIGYTAAYPDGTRKYTERRINADTASTGMFGAFVALMNQISGRPQGFLNPALYRGFMRSPASFRDITVTGGTKAVVRTDYLNGLSGKTKKVLKTFEAFGTNPPRPGYDTNTGLGSPSPSFLRYRF